MRRPERKITLLFGSGCFGALINSLCVWLFGSLGLTSALGVQIAPKLTAGWLYPRILWGGLWGFLFLLPLLRSSVLLRGLLISLGPTLAQLLYFFPEKEGYGLFGLSLGTWTPAFVFFFNAVWGISTLLWYRSVE
jgi:hypothetical protein